jgi:hypothetical protein
VISRWCTPRFLEALPFDGDLLQPTPVRYLVYLFESQETTPDKHVGRYTIACPRRHPYLPLAITLENTNNNVDLGNRVWSCLHLSYPRSLRQKILSSIMHPVLTIDELLEHIFLHCFAAGSKSEGGTVATLARTCKAFSETALKLLWGKGTIYPSALLRLFPNFAKRDADGKYVRCIPHLKREHS